jgi:hypothetical protein
MYTQYFCLIFLYYRICLKYISNKEIRQKLILLNIRIVTTLCYDPRVGKRMVMLLASIAREVVKQI